MTCSTQTDIPVIASSSQTVSGIESGLGTDIPTQSSDDMEALSSFIGKLSLDDNELDKLSLDEDR